MMQKLLLSLILLSTYVDVWAMDKGSSSNGNNNNAVAALAEKTAALSINNDNNIALILVPVPKNTTATKGRKHYTEKLNLNDTEPLSQETYAELLQAKRAQKHNHIIARVLTQGEKDTFIHIFDAHAFHNGVIGQYPFKNLQPLSTYKNPLNKLPIGALDYYAYTSKEEQYTLMCTYAALLSDNPEKRDYWRETFYANQTDNRTLQLQSQNNLGYLLVEGKSIPHDCEKAAKIFKYVAAQKDNLREAACAQSNLAYMLKEHIEIPQDLPEAFRLFTQVAAQKDNLEIVPCAQLGLADMYLNGLGVTRDLSKVKEYCNAVLSNVHSDAKQRQQASDFLAKLDQ